MGSTFQPLEMDHETLFSPLYLALRKKKAEALKKKRVIVIAGPTGVGKTRIALAVSQILGGEVISADSMQVYKGMDIGTAKATWEERKKVPHHLLDVCEVSQNYNVVSYCNEAGRALKSILLENRVPIICGGSGFYLHALLYGPPQGPPSVEAVRKKLEELAERVGIESLYERLQILDPAYALTISEKDTHKVVRALEIITLTGQMVSAFPKPEKRENENYDFRLWLIQMPRNLLYSRVEMRCEEMVEKGLIEEVRQLQKEGLENNYTASQAIGYRQALSFFKTEQKTKDLEHFLEDFKKASRHYVKRQLTWFKKEKGFRKLDINALGFERTVEYILQDFEQG
ncbi:MAG: tRNA (adenosine(37)-N6)-dimethylallyltransferase MiaA [Parachlamydiales bacterium]|jgi:tRNA dimethylallyltransferase